MAIKEYLKDIIRHRGKEELIIDSQHKADAVNYNKEEKVFMTRELKAGSIGRNQRKFLW